MAQTPAPSGEAPQWWEIIAALNPLAVLLAAIIAGVIAWRALRQRSVADRRSEWWSRAQWALEASLSEKDDRQRMGINVLLVLAKSELAGNEELDVLDAAWAEPLGQYARELDTPPEAEENEHGDEGGNHERSDEP